MHQDLLDQAEALAALDPSKPKQVNLRRAVSAAYYGLFHYLVDKSCKSVLGTQHKRRGYRHALARAFDHGAMKNACERFQSGLLPVATLRCLPDSVVVSDAQGQPARLVVPKEIDQLAAAFVEAQQKRHRADYDYAESFLRHDVVAMVREVRKVIEEFDQASQQELASFFLVCLLVWRSLGNR